MNNSFSLFQIDENIEGILESESSYDPDTGELLPELQQQLEEFAASRSDLLYELALYDRHCEAMEELVEREILRLRKLQEKLQLKADAVKKVLRTYVPEGEKHDFGTVKISWRKSARVVPEPYLDLEELEKTYPQFVKHSRELKKEEIKRHFRLTGVVPAGCEIKENNNLIVS
ncbi:MAG: siphovirus Gp157 family protein [Ignavibacteriales bacterium]